MSDGLTQPEIEKDITSLEQGSSGKGEVPEQPDVFDDTVIEKHLHKVQDSTDEQQQASETVLSDAHKKDKVEGVSSQPQIDEEVSGGEGNKKESKPATGDDFLDSLLKEAELKTTTETHQEDNNELETINNESSPDSSDSDESSDFNSSSSDSGDDDDAGQANQEEVDSDGDDDDTSGQPIMSKNEVADERAPSLPEGFSIGESDPIEEIGFITGVVEKSIIVKGNISGEFRFLKEGSVLCLEDRTPLGYLFEIFGPLAHPLYRLKFNTDEETQKFNDCKDKKVFYVVPKSNFVYTESLKALKGSDASNWNDEEIPEEEQEFSDDEKEMESKKSKNKKKRNRKNKDNDNDGKEQVKDTESEQSKKFQNRQNKDRKIQRNQPQPNRFQNPNSVPSYGYQSRSQREQQFQPATTQPYYQASQQSQVPMFRPPPQMIQSTFSQGFPVPMPPGFPPNMPNMNFQNPQQWQQFYQMQLQQQMMMQQMLVSQQGQFASPQLPINHMSQQTPSGIQPQPQSHQQQPQQQPQQPQSQHQESSSITQVSSPQNTDVFENKEQ